MVVSNWWSQHYHKKVSHVQTLRYFVYNIELVFTIVLLFH
jgi:preprotein translocase subunit Sec63